MKFTKDKKEKVLNDTDKSLEATKVRKVLKRLSIKIIGYGLLLILILNFVIGIYQIHDNDMFPSLRDGDLVITYKLGGYYTGDVVVYKADGKTHYGRVVGVDGDEINITEADYYTVNDTIPYEQIFYPTKAGDKITYPYKIQQGEVFILGDMRQQAKDSREFGAIHTKNIKGKVVLLLFRGRGF